MMKRALPALKKWSRRALYAAAIVYVLLLALVNIEPYPACPLEEHRFAEKDFDIEFCALGGGRHDEKMRLRVYDKSGHMLAWRIATFAKESGQNYMDIEDTMIRYSDNTSDLRSTSTPEDCVLNMPPTWVDWLEARLPGGIPGVNHCGTVDERLTDKARHNWFLREETQRIKRGQKPVWPNHPDVKKIQEKWTAQQDAKHKGGSGQRMESAQPEASQAQ
jgi:hypothetical protein